MKETTQVAEPEHSTSQTEPQTHQIVIAPERLFSVGSFPVTNTFLMSILTTCILVLVSILATRKLSSVPNRLQGFLEIIIDSIYTLTKDLAHSKTKVFFPIITTFFLYIVVANWMGLLPGFGTIGINTIEEGQPKFVPIFRAATSDLNMTLGLALISAIATHLFALKYLGLKGYLQKWFSLNLILLFVGLLEVVSEFTKVFSLSFRLFGNIFAGEEVLKTVSGLFAFVAPLPFYFLEIIVGFVQAAVFMMLTLVFMAILSSKHTGEEH